ncbi:CBS domain-containing protein [Salinicola aestuarinus]|uniref:CBS domain-containing protein n=1 Tax=Salinicola aestuarinus TaxID=1949082 RepID=UPI000DA1E96B|nr:CBS domain-containing protein [Salinicola aestuarinus]
MPASRPAIVADIMSRDVVTLRREQTLHDGNELMREHRVRHLPVVDDEGRLVGLLNQKVVLREAMRIAGEHGTQALSQHLDQVPLAGLIGGECHSIAMDKPLADAGRQLLSLRVGALPVVDGEHLVGIVSSVDFVRLAVDELVAQEN